MMTFSTEIAAARPEDTREVLERLWVALGNAMPGRAYNYVHDYPYRTGDERTLKFFAMLDCGAFLSAAEMLVPENWGEWQVGRQPWKGDKSLCYVLDRSIRHEPLLIYAATPALALAAAIAKSFEDNA